MREGIPVRVQPNPRRIFTDEEYRRAGAVVDEDLSPCSIIFGVKEIPPDLFLEEKAYVFFAHVIKGQKYNMPMFRRMMERRCHLIDYERIVDEKGRRLVLFGRHAGLAGMIETLRAAGKRLEAEGFDTPLARIKMALEYDSLEEARTAIRDAGASIREGEWPAELTPFTIGFAGYGNVSQGAQEIYGLLDPVEVSPGDLASGAPAATRARPFVKVVFYEKDLVEPVRPGDAFELRDYYDHPEKYRSVFERHLPHLDALVNAVYWDDRYPRFVTLDWLRRAWSGGKPRLRVIGDITCDIGGAVESTVKAMEPGNPCFVYEPLTGETVEGVVGNGPVMMTVDILPAELPREASLSFGEALAPFLADLARADLSLPRDRVELPGPIREALILHKGELTEDYRYLTKYLGQE